MLANRIILVIVAAVVIAGGAAAAFAVIASDPEPQGRLLYTSDRHADSLQIHVAGPGGSGVERLTSEGDNEQAAGSPDGRRIAYKTGRFGSGDLVVLDLATRRETIVTRTFRIGEGQPAWSPDGSELVYRQVPENPLVQDGEIYAVDVEAAMRPGYDPRRPRTRRLLAREGDERYPNLSPDGSRLVFRCGRDLEDKNGDEEICVLDLDSRELRELTDDETVDSSPVWSPDGETIAFESDRDGSFDVYAMDADGSGVRRLTDSPALDEGPAFSPDGDHIAFTSERDGNLETYTMRADGSDERNVSRHAALEESPAWLPQD